MLDIRRNPLRGRREFLDCASNLWIASRSVRQADREWETDSKPKQTPRWERIVRAHPSVLFAQHVESFGCQLFDIVRERDLEGIVAKRKDAAYGLDWFKIRNNEYSQYEGRRELFEKRSSRVS